MSTDCGAQSLLAWTLSSVGVAGDGGEVSASPGDGVGGKTSVVNPVNVKESSPKESQSSPPSCPSSLSAPLSHSAPPSCLRPELVIICCTSELTSA